MLEPRKTRDALIDDETGRRPLSRKDFADSLTTPAEPIEPADLITRDDAEIIDDDEDEIDRRPANTTDQEPVSENDSMTPLFSEFEMNDLRARWSDVQAGFVDSPRHSVEQADELVATVMHRITSGLAQERSSLEQQWDRGDNVSTEDLRVALQRYRAFFGRLLNAA
jgi:hypothetical protein